MPESDGARPVSARHAFEPQRNGTGRAAREFYLTPDWVGCAARSAAGEMQCPLQLALQGASLDAFTYRRDRPADGQLHWRRGFKATVLAAIIVAAPERLDGAASRARQRRATRCAHRRRYRSDSARYPALLRSTFTQLMFLDGRYAKDARSTSAAGAAAIASSPGRWIGKPTSSSAALRPTPRRCRDPPACDGINRRRACRAAERPAACGCQTPRAAARSGTRRNSRRKRGSVACRLVYWRSRVRSPAARRGCSGSSSQGWR